MRLVLELWSLLRQGLAHGQAGDDTPGRLASARENDHEPAARDNEFYYRNRFPGLGIQDRDGCI